MKTKKVKKISAFISMIMACATLVGVTSSATMKLGVAENNPIEFSSGITAVSNAHGEEVTILPEDVKLWTESEQFDADYLNGLYEYSGMHKEFLSVVGSSNEELVDIYRQTDVFNPVNNVLTWQSTLENVKSYTVRVAYDNKFTQCVMKVENASIKEGVVLENPLVGTDYYWQVIATMGGGKKVYSPIFDFTTADTMRTVTVDGVSNTRDLGGYETAYGYVQQGLVYRSARLESITKDGLHTLKTELGVKTDLDLRGKSEANSAINRENPAELENYYLYVTPQYALAGELGLDAPIHYENVKNIMTVFANKANYPIDVHCAVGRDRTGTIVALLKSLIGFAENDIINDYFTSMFATTGAWEKSVTHTNQAMIMNVLNYLNSFEGETLADRAANYLISKCGMSQAEIDSIRNIMTGKEKVDLPVYNTFADEDNYANYAFVTFEKFGVTRVVKTIGIGETVNAPFEAGEGYGWTVDGQAFDFATAISGDITIKALKTKVYEVKIVSMGAVTSEETVTVAEGEAFDFSTLAKDGYDCIVISDEGQILTSVTVNRNMTLNVIYTHR